VNSELNTIESHHISGLVQNMLAHIETRATKDVYLIPEAILLKYFKSGVVLL